MPAPPPAPKKSRRSDASYLLENISEDEMESPFTLYFIDSSDANLMERQNLQETFKIAKKAELMPEWMDSKKVNQLQNSEDCFVIPCFRGDLFKKMQNKSFRLYGCPITVECILEGKPLPQNGHPVYSSVFEGARISFTNLEPSKKNELSEKLNWMCGTVTDCLSSESTHLVVGKSKQTEKYKTAIKNSIKLMRTGWIEDLWETSQTTIGMFSGLVRDAVNSYKLRVFEGLEMAVTSIDGSDRSSLIQLIEENGGKIPGNMSKSRCSHLVTDKTNGEKYIKATEWKTIHIVQTRWIRKCIQSGHLIDETKHHPKYMSLDYIPPTTSSKRNSMELVADSSQYAGMRISSSSLNLSSSLNSLDQTLTSNSPTAVAGARRSAGGDIKQRSDQLPSTSTSLVRNGSVPLVRIPTNQSISTQDLSLFSADCNIDPIDNIRKQIDDEHKELFENCSFHICGVDDRCRQEKWRRFLNETGATRAPAIETATNIVVILPNQQEKAFIRKLVLEQEDVTIVTVQWVEECIRKREIVSGEGFEWTEVGEDGQ